MLRRLYRQRRRVALCTGLAFLWIAVMSFVSPEHNDFDVTRPVNLIAALITAWLITSVLVAAFALLLPGLRFVLEIAFIATTVSALLAPVTSLGPAWVGIAVFFGAFFLTERLLYMPLLDGVTTSHVRTKSRRMSVSATPDQVWRALVPEPGHEATFHYPGTVFAADPDAGAVEAAYPIRSGHLSQLERFQVLERAAPTRFVADFAPVTDGPEQAGLTGQMRIEITPTETGSEVVLTEERGAAPLRRRLQWWIDDEFGDRTDSMMARIEGRPDWSFFATQFPKRPQAGHPAPA